MYQQGNGMSMYGINDRLKALSERTGYNIAQENGQRKTGPPPFWTGPPPPKGCEIFIGKLPRNIFEDELFPLFQTAGVIYEFRLMMDFSCSNRGFAFATYATKEEAQRAIILLNDYEIRPGRRIGVLKSVDNCKLYIGGLPTNKSKDEIYEEISKHTSGVIKVVVNTCPFNITKNNGFAFVEYESHRAASMARKILIPGNVKLFNCEVIVDWATAEPEAPMKQEMKSNWAITSSQSLNGDVSKNVDTVLFVRGIPDQITEGYLLYLFSFQGCLPIYRIKKIKDFAFVHYFTTCDAQIAMNKLNGFNLGCSSIMITWAKPNSKSLSENHMFKRTSNPNLVETFQSRQCDKNALQNNPIKILSDVCKANGWGEPVYHIVHTSSSVDEIETTFSAKVFIPCLPLPVKCFAVAEVSISPKEAKNFVAEYALKTIATHVTFSNDQHPSAALPCPKQNSLPMTHNVNIFKENWSSCSSVWNSEIQSSVDSNFLDQDSFHNLLASAASLASVQLQTNLPSQQICKME